MNHDTLCKTFDWRYSRILLLTKGYNLKKSLRTSGVAHKKRTKSLFGYKRIGQLTRKTSYANETKNFTVRKT